MYTVIPLQSENSPGNVHSFNLISQKWLHDIQRLTSAQQWFQVVSNAAIDIGTRPSTLHSYNMLVLQRRWSGEYLVHYLLVGLSTQARTALHHSSRLHKSRTHCKVLIGAQWHSRCIVIRRMVSWRRATGS
jgi:hypothetical protein